METCFTGSINNFMSKDCGIRAFFAVESLMSNLTFVQEGLANSNLVTRS